MPAAAMAALALLAGGCTASDPDNALDINQAITDNNDNDDDSDAKDPTGEYHLTSYRIGNCGYSLSYDPISWLPISATAQSEDSYGNPTTTNYTFTVIDNQVTEVRWNTKEEIYQEDYHYNTSETVLSDLQFEDGLLKGCSYTSTAIKYDHSGAVLSQDNTSYTVAFTYDSEKHLTRIVANNQVFDQTWNENGDLISINSPMYGKSTVNYTTVENRWLQWEPTLPFMGFFQTFGWFGKAPKHFPSSISKSDGSLLPDQDFKSASLDYYIDYDGTIQQARWTYTSAFYYDVNFGYN